MPFVGHDHIDNSVCASSLVWGSIYIIDWDRLQQFVGRELSAFYEVLVNEISSGSGVYHGFDQCFFHHVGGFEMCRDHEAVWAFFKQTDD